MNPRSDQRLRLDPAAEQALDRRMLLLTVVFWLAHLAMMSSRAMTGELILTWAATAARLITCLVGAGLCYGGYVLLKRAPTGVGLRQLAWAFAASTLSCLIFTAVNKAAFTLLVPDKMLVTLKQNVMDVIETFIWFEVEFIAWAALYTALVGSALLREREQRLAVAESEAQKAQLSALRLQIQPHFLFNTLNTLSGLIALGRSEQAEQLILNLSNLMRRTLATAPDQMASLGEEIRAQVMYLSIEQARFPDRLVVRCAVDEGCLKALAPGMILQPLVENAVKHGLTPSEGAVEITLGCARRGEELEIWVSNRPAPPESMGSAGLGIGLANVRERLNALFGEHARLEAGPDAGGWTSRLVLPWTAPA